MQINSNFDSGNIEVIDLTQFDNIQLKIRKDSNAAYCQWFHFQLTGAKNKNCVLKIVDASECSYPKAWEGYQACTSYDRNTWFRVPTHYDGHTLTINHRPEYDSVYYAFFPPYSYEQHLNLIARTQQLPYCSLTDLGQTLDGRPLTLLTLGNEKTASIKLWIIARQHAGESMAEWFMEGLLARLADSNDPVTRALLASAVFYLVPNMNPDGSVRGHLRGNAKGTDLNRSWQNPSKEISPEVYYVREKMQQTGVDFFFDVHGDEELPYVFLAGAEDNPSYSAKQQHLTELFTKKLLERSPDFQTTYGYGPRQFGDQTLKLATNYVADHFNCLAFTLEMPFKDNANLPNPLEGWSPARSKILAKACLDVIHSIAPFLKKD